MSWHYVREEQSKRRDVCVHGGGEQARQSCWKLYYKLRDVRSNKSVGCSLQTSKKLPLQNRMRQYTRPCWAPAGCSELHWEEGGRAEDKICHAPILHRSRCPGPDRGLWSPGVPTLTPQLQKQWLQRRLPDAWRDAAAPSSGWKPASCRADAPSLLSCTLELWAWAAQAAHCLLKFCLSQGESWQLLFTNIQMNNNSLLWVFKKYHT